MEYAAGLLLLAPLALAACRPEPELPPIVWEGEHLRYRTREPIDAICEGTFQHMDRRAGHLKALLDAPATLVDYAWAPGAALSEYCDSSLGCFDGRAAFSKLPLCEHELFHAARGSTSHRGLEEGMATFFGDDRVLPGEVGDDADALLRATGEFTLPRTVDYPTLGHFVSFLHAQFGPSALARTDRASSIDDDYGDLAAVIEAVTGVPLAESVAEYRASYPICPSREYRYDGFECQQEGIELPAIDADTIDFQIVVGCGEPGTIGPRGPEIWKTVALHAALEGQYRISVVPDDLSSALVRVSTCDRSCFKVDGEPDVEVAGFESVQRCARPGAPVLLRLAARADKRVTFEIRVTRLIGSRGCD